MDLIITFGPAILLVITGFWFAYQFVAPPPPKKFVITTGSKSGTYDKIADLSNLNIAIGKEGSGTRILAKQILKLNHIENSEPKLFG
ncbi:MAG: hypothetical protein HN791_09090, partial [Gammaproteobacteria bacterium]|nr:hypothetical protein [Gammaproteobacteria bacterium]